MNIELTPAETARVQALADNLTTAEVRGVPPKDRPKVIVYRALAAGLDALEKES